jgi:HK97 family phage portal protein
MATIFQSIRNLLGIRAQSPEDPRINLSQWYSELTGTGDGDLVPLPMVTENTARSVSAVYRGVSLLAGAIASLPLQVVHKPNDGIARIAPEHRISSLLNYAPHPQQSMTAYTFKHLIMQSRVFGGNFFARIMYDGAARIIGLRYYHYYRVRVVPLLEPPYTRHYVFTEADGTTSPPIPDDEVIHIMSDANDGLVGESLIYTHAKPAIQQMLFLQQQARNVHANAVKASGVVKLPQGITPDQKKRYEQFFKMAYAGSANVGNLLWLDAGADFTQLTPSLSLVDLDTIEFMQFQVNDIARFLGVPSFLLNETSTMTVWGSGIEQIGRAFLTYTLEPHLRAIEEELRFKLLGNGDYYVQFDRTPLLAMDAQTQAQVESTKINSGVWLINERRTAANLPPVENGDQPLVNSTMVPLSTAAAKTALPAPAKQTRKVNT